MNKTDKAKRVLLYIITILIDRFKIKVMLKRLSLIFTVLHLSVFQNRFDKGAYNMFKR